MKKINLAIIGVGSMGRRQIQQFVSIPGIQVIACADCDIKRARKIAKEFGIENYYDNYIEMLDKHKIDAVSNATSDSAHFAVAAEVLARKIHILSEKPLANSMDAAIQLRDFAAEAGVINMVNFSYRNSAALQHGAALVRKGKMGRVLHVEASFLQDWHFGLENCNWVDGDGVPHHWALWRCSSNHGGLGVIGDIGCHIFDFVSMICNDDISEIAALSQTFPKATRIEGYAMDANNSFVSAIKLAGGGEGVIHVTHAAPGHYNHVRCNVYCEKGSLEFDSALGKDSYRLYTGNRKLLWRTVQCKPTPNNYERFIKAVRTGKPPADGNDFANGCKIQACMHYGIESAQQRKTMEIIV